MKESLVAEAPATQTSLSKDTIPITVVDSGGGGRAQFETAVMRAQAAIVARQQAPNLPTLRKVGRFGNALVQGDTKLRHGALRSTTRVTGGDGGRREWDQSEGEPQPRIQFDDHPRCFGGRKVRGHRP